MSSLAKSRTAEFASLADINRMRIEEIVLMRAQVSAALKETLAATQSGQLESAADEEWHSIVQAVTSEVRPESEHLLVVRVIGRLTADEKLLVPLAGLTVRLSRGKELRDQQQLQSTNSVGLVAFNLLPDVNSYVLEVLDANERVHFAERIARMNSKVIVLQDVQPFPNTLASTKLWLQTFEKARKQVVQLQQTVKAALANQEEMLNTMTKKLEAKFQELTAGPDVPQPNIDRK